MMEDCPMDMYDETPMDTPDYDFEGDDGQPTMYEEYQDLYDGDDYYDHSESL